MPGRILLVEDNEGDAYILQRLLKTPPANYETTHASSLAAALMALHNDQSFVAILLDLNLGDCQGLDTLVRINDAAPMLPILILTGVDDLELAQSAVRKGAQDYLVKSDVQGGILERAVRLSWERKRKEQVRKDLAYESLGALGVAAPQEDPAVPLIRGHLKSTLRFFEALHDYVHKNAPQHAEALAKLEEQFGIDLVLRDMGAVLRGSTMRPRKISDRALAVVTATAGDVSLPANEEEAREAILRIVSNRR